MRGRFDAEYIRRELEGIGEDVGRSVSVYLIGGGSMVFSDLKDATKDIDLVVLDGESIGELQTSLQEQGYRIVSRPGGEYQALGAQRILENDDGCRIDIFNRQVANKLVLSPEMRERSEQLLHMNDFSVNLVSAEDIFLFKAVAGRTDDIDDLFVLFQTALEFDTIAAELRNQTELLGQNLFVTYVNESLVELENRHNITTPISDAVANTATQIYLELQVLHALEESSAVSELHDALELSSDVIDTVLDRLEQKAVVAVDGEKITQLSDEL